MPGGESQKPGLSLVGTVVASDPRWSRASLSTGPERGKTRVYRVGDRLPDQTTLTEIHADRVVLDRDGVREVLLLQEHSRKTGRTEPPSPEASEAGPDRFRIDRDELMELLEKADDLLRQARISLSFGADGGIQGVSLAMLDSNTAFEKIGLVNGDVIHRIGSLVIDHPDKLKELADLLMNVRELDVELSREGEMKTLRYFID
jgi:general secretion pathway protein C